MGIGAFVPNQPFQKRISHSQSQLRHQYNVSSSLLNEIISTQETPCMSKLLDLRTRLTIVPWSHDP